MFQNCQKKYYVFFSRKIVCKALIIVRFSFFVLKINVVLFITKNITPCIYIVIRRRFVVTFAFFYVTIITRIIVIIHIYSSVTPLPVPHIYMHI